MEKWTILFLVIGMIVILSIAVFEIARTILIFGATLKYLGII